MTIGAKRYPIVLPSSSDPRLRLAATILTVHFLGQVALGFELSIAQILIAMGTCAVLEIFLTAWMKGVFAWPASALLTGSGVALILRVNGTEHGDWWSLNGWYIFAATAALGLLSKYAIRVGGRPLFNPSNVALVACFLILGTLEVNPLDFWWGPLSPALLLAIAVIAMGGLFVTKHLGLLPISLAFWATFAASLAVVAARGHCMSARWSVGPVCDWSFWWVLVTSPEILIFMLFMITDPKTIPAGRSARIAFGALVGFVTALLVAPQTTEFASKVAVLAGLVILCAFRPLLERFVTAERVARFRALGRPARVGTLVVVTIACAGALVIAGFPAVEPIAGTEVPTADLTARPEVPLPDGQPPAITIDPDSATVAGGISQATADTMARDLAEDLVIEGDALSRGDAGLLGTAATGRRLAAGQATIATGERPEPTRYTFDRMRVVVVRTPGNPQAPPSVGIHGVGTSNGPGGTKAVDRVWVLQRVADTYLIADKTAPE